MTTWTSDSCLSKVLSFSYHFSISCYHLNKIFAFCFSQDNPNCTVHWGVGVMVFNATFNDISIISRWSVLLVKETGAPGENHQPAASHWQTQCIVKQLYQIESLILGLFQTLLVNSLTPLLRTCSLVLHFDTALLN